MYEIYINNEMNNITYKKIIEYAIKKSDAFMLILRNYNLSVEDMYKVMDKDEFIKGFIDAAKEEGRTPDLTRYLKYYDLSRKNLELQKERARKNRKIFLESSKVCWDKFKPYLIKGKNL